MPRIEQIIPEYQVPHVQTIINDNSSFTDVSTVVSDDGVRFLNVFASEKGEDGVVKLISSAADYIEEFGTPNYEKYGQACYMPYVALQSGNARCWCMRVMPENATFANLVIVAKTKVGDSDTVVANNGVNLDGNADTTNPNTLNANAFYVSSTTNAGNVHTVNIKAHRALETNTLYSDNSTWEGKWFGVLVNAGTGIVGNTAVTKSGGTYTFGEVDVKEAAAAGGPEYEVREINGVPTYIVQDSYSEVLVENEDGTTTTQINYTPYSHWVQWLNEEDFTFETKTLNGVEYQEGVRTIEYTMNGVNHTLNLVYTPYVEGTTVADYSHFEIKFEANYIENLTDKNGLAVYMNQLANVDDEGNIVAGDDGYFTYPVIGVAAKGRGEYGNSLRLRLSSDTISDRENEYKNYIIEVLNNDKTLIRKEYFRASIYEEAVVDYSTLYANDVINDMDSGSSKIELYVDSDRFSTIYNQYVSALDTSVNYPAFETFDFLFGKMKNSTTVNIPYYSIAADSIALDGTDGIVLQMGAEGSFDVDDEGRMDAINAAYIEAFTGLDSDGAVGRFDKALLSKRRTPAEFILDANYPDDVKNALVNLALKRYDAQLILDATINRTTISQAVRWSNDMINTADCVITKECTGYKVKDPFNGKTITVTSTYNAAQLLPDHWDVYGNHIPFVGERYTLLSGFVRNSVFPPIDADDLEVKETLYNNHVNFYECIGENRFVKGTQSTSQLTSSDLSEMNNVAVLLDMKRRLEDFVSQQIYNFAEAADRINFTASAEEMFASYKNNKIKTFEISFNMNEFEETRSILHCYLAVTFRTMAKRGIIEIDINRRV